MNDVLFGNNQYLCFGNIYIYSIAGVISDKTANCFKQQATAI